MNCRRHAPLLAWAALFSMTLVSVPAPTRGQGQQVHGENSSFVGHGVAMVWGVLRGSSEEDTQVILRIAPAGGEYAAMHTGYDTSTVDQDPDRIVPLDAMRVLEKNRRFKKLHDQYFVTTGTGAMPSKMAELGAGIAGELASAGVNAVILTAT